MSVDRTAFRVPGEDASPAAPVALSAIGLVGAACAAILFASSEAGADDASAAPKPSTSATVATSSAPRTSEPAAPSATVAASSAPSASASSSTPDACAIRVAFASNAPVPGASARIAVDKLGAWLVAHPDVTVLVHGHADSVGTEDGNLRLSHMRAEAIARELAASGVARARMTVRGFGAYQPVEGVGEDHADNRRVVVHLRGACPRGFEEVVGP